MTVGDAELKPRLLLLADRRDWAFDAAAKAVASHLRDEFDFKISYVAESPDLFEWPFDLIHVFFWGEQYHHKFVEDPNMVIKEISSHRWENESQYGCVNESEMASRYLADAATITTTSLRLYNRFSSFRDVVYTPNGIDPNAFFDKGKRCGPLKIGWAGNLDDPCKGVNDIIIPALQGVFDVRLAPGDCSRDEMCQFYNSIDVLCVASFSEGEPLTLLEGMACGCFPLCVDVGIVPELIDHLKNGLIVPRSVDSFRSAALWCKSNLDNVRSAGQFNAAMMLATRTWAKAIPFWRGAFRAALKKASAGKVRQFHPVSDDPVKDVTWHNNLGVSLLEWPERAEAAGRLLLQLDLQAGDSLIDLGSGHQTLRRFLNPAIGYLPVDRVARTADTIVLDLNQQLPEGHYSAASMLGLVEYLNDPMQVFRWIAQHARYCVFSYSDCSDEDKRRRQHWQSRMGFAEIEAMVRSIGGRFLQTDQYAEGARLYLVDFNGVLTTSSSPRRLALISAGVNRTNCGDALIEDSIRRILKQHLMSTFPLLRPLSEREIEEINGCDAAIICGTNLYQSTFACALTPDVIEKIRIPILPFGVGSSAPIGEIPTMAAEGVKAVRMLHDRCVVSSVRDPASLAFVRSLGISNVALTGCPVLFHALTEPDFSKCSGDKLFVSVRARLLHVDQELVAREIETLENLSRVFRPILVLASPHDVPLAQAIVEKYRLQYLLDDRYTEAPLTQGVRYAGRTAGFRLHFGMLSLAYGKHTTLIGTDTRVSEFCNMMGIGYHDVNTYSDQSLIQELLSPPPPMTSFVANWRDLRTEMASVLKANGLAHQLTL